MLCRIPASMLIVFLHHEISFVLLQSMSVAVVKVSLLVINRFRKLIFSHINCKHLILEESIHLYLANLTF